MNFCFTKFLLNFPKPCIASSHIYQQHNQVEDRKIQMSKFICCHYSPAYSFSSFEKRVINIGLISFDKTSRYIFKHRDVGHAQLYSGLITVVNRLRAGRSRNLGSILGNSSTKRPERLWLSYNLPFSW